MPNFHSILLKKVIENYVKTDPLKNGGDMTILEYKVSKETYVILMRDIIKEYGLTKEIIKWVNDFDDETQAAVFTTFYEEFRKGENVNDNEKQNLIKYYESKEQYEICAELVQINSVNHG